jgi:hypothetical protein
MDDQPNILRSVEGSLQQVHGLLASLEPSDADTTWLELAPKTMSAIESSLAALGRAFSLHACKYRFSNVGRQRWGHVQPYYKETRITPGVEAWHCDLQALVMTCLNFCAEYAKQRPSPELIRLCAQLCRAALLRAVATSLGFIAALYATLRPSRARLSQWAVDVVAVSAAALTMRRQASAIECCTERVPAEPALAGGAGAAVAALTTWLDLAAEDAELELESTLCGLFADFAVTAGPAGIAIEICERAVAAAETTDRRRDGAVSPGTREVAGDDGEASALLSEACDFFAAALGLGGTESQMEKLLALLDQALSDIKNVATSTTAARPTASSAGRASFDVLSVRAIFSKGSGGLCRVGHAELLAALRHTPQSAAGEQSAAHAPAAATGPATASPSAPLIPWAALADLWLAPHAARAQPTSDSQQRSTRESSAKNPSLQRLELLLRALKRRHEVGDWEWPLLSAHEAKDRERLLAAITAIEATLASKSPQVPPSQTPLRGVGQSHPPGVAEDLRGRGKPPLPNATVIAVGAARGMETPAAAALSTDADVLESSLLSSSSAGTLLTSSPAPQQRHGGLHTEIREGGLLLQSVLSPGGVITWGQSIATTTPARRREPPAASSRAQQEGSATGRPLSTGDVRAQGPGTAAFPAAVQLWSADCGWACSGPEGEVIVTASAVATAAAPAGSTAASATVGTGGVPLVQAAARAAAASKLGNK